MAVKREEEASRNKEGMQEGRKSFKKMKLIKENTSNIVRKSYMIMEEEEEETSLKCH